jgi:integrase
MRDSNVANAA